MTNTTARTWRTRRATTSLAVLGLGTALLAACTGAPTNTDPAAAPGPTTPREVTTSVVTASLTEATADGATAQVAATGTAAASPKDGITAPYTDGWQPRDWAGLGGPLDALRCGMPVAQLEGLAGSTDLEAELTGTPAPSARWDGWDLPVDVTLAPAAEIPVLVADPTLVWSQGGVVVDLSSSRSHGTQNLAGALGEDSVWSGAAWAGSASSCRPETLLEQHDYPFATYVNERAGGTYDVRVATVSDVEGNGERDLVLSDPVTITVESGVGASLPGANPGWTDPEVPAYGQGWEEGRLALPLLGIECLDHESSFVTTDPRYSLELTGAASGPYWDWRAPARLVSNTGAPAQEWGEPVLVLLRTDGRLAGIGYDPTMAWSRVAAGTDTAEATAMMGITTMCREHSGGPFEPNHVPAGAYVVRAMTEVPPRDFATKRELVFSDPVPVVVDAEGNVSSR